MTYTLENPITGDGLPGSNIDMRFLDQLYAGAKQPSYAAAMPMQGYDPLFSPLRGLNEALAQYGKMGATPRSNNPLVQGGGLNLDNLLSTLLGQGGLQDKGKQGGQNQGYALLIMAIPYSTSASKN